MKNKKVTNVQIALLFDLSLVLILQYCVDTVDLAYFWNFRLEIIFAYTLH